MTSELNTCACISCGKTLQVENSYQDMPPLGKDELERHSPIHPGIYLSFESYGNYGSAVHDYSGFKIQGYLCDECFVQKADRLYTWPVSNDDDRPCIATRLTTHPTYESWLKERDVFGPAWLSKHDYGETWIDGIRYYRELTSEQRSEAEKVLMEQKGAEVTLSRELLDNLLGGLRASEHNRIFLEQKNREVKWQNELLKQQLAGEPRGREVSALLFKEASELAVTELKEIIELSRWATKVQDWMDKHKLFYEDGTEVDTMRLWAELTEGAEGIRKWEETQARIREHVRALTKCATQSDPESQKEN